MPRLSVIIPTCNRNEMLGLCLERLAPGKQMIPESDYEVIVTDDSTGDGAELFCKLYFPFVRYHRGPLKGPAANRNSGASLATSQWLVFTDDDCLPEADWLKAYSEAIQLHPDCKAFEGAILPDDWSLLKQDLAECPVNEKGGCFWSANIMVERTLFFLISGFDEQFKIAAQEDQDIYLRLKQFTEVLFIRLAVIVHPVRINSMVRLLKQARSRSENYLLYATKNAAFLGYKSKRQILWKGGIIAQSFSILGAIRRFNFKQAIVSLFTLFLIYFPKLIFGEIFSSKT